MNIEDPFEFLWDKGNKNQTRHNVKNEEIEQVFWDEEKKIYRDCSHSNTEERLLLLGKTFDQRVLFIVFTIRNGKVRVISARDLNKRELNLYYKQL